MALCLDKGKTNVGYNSVPRCYGYEEDEIKGLEARPRPKYERPDGTQTLRHPNHPSWLLSIYYVLGQRYRVHRRF